MKTKPEGSFFLAKNGCSRYNKDSSKLASLRFDHYTILPNMFFPGP
jgi:hypothetical protein